MKFDSIKSRVMLMTCICIFGMALLVCSQFYFSHRLNRLHSQHEFLLDMQQELLQLRRHEKDFLARHEIDYFNRFTARAELFSKSLIRLAPLLNEYSLPISRNGELAKNIYQYQHLFQSVVTLQLKLGLTDKSGIHGELKDIEKALQSSASFSYGTAAYQRFVKAQLGLRNYQLTKESESASQFMRAIDSMLALVSGDDKAKVSQYSRTFQTYEALEVELGINHNSGLRGRFRAKAHDVENTLSEIEQSLSPLLLAQEQNIRIYSLVIAATTSMSVIVLLIKSFATFHRAFANFVMFFYRSKRQYQKIDPGPLGFAEFRSLAVLVNDMVESRRDTQLALAQVRAELDACRANDHTVV